MLDKLIGGIAGFGQGYGHKDYRSGGYGFQEHKEFVSHVETEGGFFDRQARYDHRMRLPANHGRPPMTHMPVCDEEDSDVEEYFEDSRSHHITTLPHHNQQPPHRNFMPPPPVAQPHHNGKMGKMGNEWQGQQEDAHHGRQGMQHHGGHGIQHHSEHGMQHHDMHGMQHQGGHGMQHHGEHGMQHHDMHGMQHQGGHGMQHQGGHGMQHQGGHGMKHHDRLMAPHVPPRHGYMNPNHGSGDGRAVVVKATENWRVSNSTGRKIGWGSKGL